MGPHRPSFSSDCGRSMDALNFMWASNSASSSTAGMRVRAVKDSRLTYVPQAKRMHVRDLASVSCFMRASPPSPPLLASMPRPCIGLG